MVVVLTITQINYLMVKPILCDLVRPPSPSSHSMSKLKVVLCFEIK